MRSRRNAGNVSRRRKIPLVNITLDAVTWEALAEIAASQARTVDDLVVEIARDSLGVAIRIYVVEFYRAAEADTPAPQ
jgi:predicted DNA-binding ribbon-helix-helix protein